MANTCWTTHLSGIHACSHGGKGHIPPVANMRPSAGWKMLSVQILPWREGPTGCFQDARLRDEQRVTQSKNEVYWLAE